MRPITRRDDVVQRLAKNSRAEIEAAIVAVNAAVDGAKSLPITIAADLLGRHIVREEVVRLIKESGWTIKATPGPDDYFTLE